MYKVYANILGVWTLLDNRVDTINGLNPHKFVEERLCKYHEPQIFLTIIHDNKHYYMSYNNIMYIDED